MSPYHRTTQLATPQTDWLQRPSCETLGGQDLDLNLTNPCSLTCISLNINPAIPFAAGDSRKPFVVGPKRSILATTTLISFIAKFDLLSVLDSSSKTRIDIDDVCVRVLEEVRVGFAQQTINTFEKA